MPGKSHKSAEGGQANQDSVGPKTQLTVSIYQNAEHVSGILQQAYRAPLITEESRESLLEQKDQSSVAHDTGGNLGGKASVPVLGEISAGLRHGRTSRDDEAVTQGARSTQKFVFSQAYYLYVVRDFLRARGQLKTVESLADTAGLNSGDFVEYQAEFRPNEINALLDILTPQLVGAIAAYRVNREAMAQYLLAEDTAEIQRLALIYDAKAKYQSVIAEAVAEAVRVDFRSEKTREFYGTIGEGDETVTAVTICDTAHFVVEDEDRILDGRFTVLGKVTSAPEVDVPLLERNKLLERLKPTAVDEVFDKLRDLGTAPATGGMFQTADDLIDLELNSRIEGTSFKVVPIAIYA